MKTRSTCILASKVTPQPQKQELHFTFKSRNNTSASKAGTSASKAETSASKAGAIPRVLKIRSTCILASKVTPQPQKQELHFTFKSRNYTSASKMGSVHLSFKNSSYGIRQKEYNIAPWWHLKMWCHVRCFFPTMCATL